MKKGIITGLLLLLFFCLTGCEEKGLTFDIGQASKIELRSGNSGKEIEITDPEDIQYITENINQLTYYKDKSREGYTGWSYSLVWYDSKGNVMERMVIMSRNYIDYKEYFYNAIGTAKCIDTDYLDSLLDER